MKISRIVIVLFISATILVAVNIYITLGAVNKSEHATFERKRSLITMDASSRLLSNIIDAETGIRGYILTGEKNYLEPYWTAKDKMVADLKTLHDVMLEDSSQQTLIHAIEPILDKLMVSYASYIQLESNHHNDEALARLKLGLDKKLMDEIRQLIRKFEKSETASLAQREEQFDYRLSNLSLVNTTSSIMILLMAMFSSLFIYRESRQRILSQDQANKDLLEHNLDLSKEVLMRQKVEIELRIAAVAFESQEGVFVTDSDSLILRVNNAFTQITGYTSEEAVGQTPRLLSSGKHDPTFYANMWKEITHNDAWQGEVWNRRKNGEVYPEYLTITAVKDGSGMVSNYVASLTDITKSKAASEEINSLAYFDPLTHLPNRRLLVDRLEHALATSGRSRQCGALLFLDLDYFKTLNDTLGHDAGDTLLQQVATRLTDTIREGDTVARLGGDEFVVLLERLSEQVIEAAAQTQDIAEKIIVVLNQSYQLGAHEHRSTPSIGATVFSGNEETSGELLKQADLAMYHSKDSGRNTVRFFDPVMQEAITLRADMERDLRKAIEHNQFQLYYQIQVSSSGQALGAEALIRWLHPSRARHDFAV